MTAAPNVPLRSKFTGVVVAQPANVNDKGSSNKSHTRNLLSRAGAELVIRRSAFIDPFCGWWLWTRGLGVMLTNTSAVAT
jgi:hypothetical protein